MFYEAFFCMFEATLKTTVNTLEKVFIIILDTVCIFYLSSAFFSDIIWLR